MILIQDAGAPDLLKGTLMYEKVTGVLRDKQIY